MADHSGLEKDIQKQSMDQSCEMSDSSFDFVQDIMSKVKDISTLATRAKLQAKEAEIRAKYSLQFAERAIEEAKSAHVVSASLAKTSHVVAMLALQITNDTDYLIDGTNYNDESFLVLDAGTQTLQNADNVHDTEELLTQLSEADSESASDDKMADSIDKDSMSKLEAVYPHDLRTDDMKTLTVNLSHLPVISEERNSQNIIEMEGETTDDAKRTMMLYKDSKLMKTKGRRSMEKGDAEALVYEEHGTQTC